MVNSKKNGFQKFFVGWRTIRLKEICERITKGSTPTSYGYRYKAMGIRFVKAENINSNGFLSTTTNYIDDETNQFLQRSILKEDDLLFSIAGTIGRVGAVRTIDLPANTNQALAIIRLKPGIVDSRYLFYFLKSDAIQKKALDKIVGVGRANLSLTNLGEFEIPIAPKNQQKLIVAEIEKQFSRLDQAIENLKRVKANLKRYKAAVLKAAVEGKLTEQWRKANLPAPSTTPGKFYIYAILCDDDSLYIGQTDDIERRWKEHLDGKGADWTKKHKPIKIAHYEEFDTRSEAAAREKWLKTGYGRKWLKRELVAGRTRQAGRVEPADKLLERILKERRKRWEEAELAKMKAKGKEPKDDKWKKAYKEPSEADEIKLDELPSGWKWYSSDQLFWFVTSGSRGWAKYYSNSGAIFLRIGNLDHDSVSLDLGKKNFVRPPKGTEGIRTRVEKNDILISITADVGMIGIVPKDFGEAYINQHISLARPVSSINSLYIAWYLTSKNGQYQFTELQRGATKAGLGLDDIRSINIPIPPLEEQAEIISQIEKCISAVDVIGIQIDKKLKSADRLRQSILKKAFSGQLIKSSDEYESGEAYELQMAAEAGVPYGAES